MSELKVSLQKDSQFTYKTISLNDEEIQKIKSSREILRKALSFEELFDKIIETFLEFKSQLYTNNLFLTKSFRRDYNANYEIRSKLNRQVFNTLNLSKLYLDKNYREFKNKDKEITKITSFVKKVTNDELVEEEVRNFLKEIHDNNPYYKLGYALRNLIQHDTLPIQTYSIDTRQSLSAEDSVIHSKFHLPLSKQNLLSCGIKKTVLKSFDESIDLHEVMDGFIYSLSQIHMKNRKLTYAAISDAQRAFLLKSKYIEEQYIDSQIEIVLYENEKKLFYLDLEWFQVFDYLLQKNSVAINYQKIEHTTYS